MDNAKPHSDDSWHSRPHVVKCWAKIVDAVDITKSDGYAFSGKFVRAEEAVEVPEGAVVILVDSRKHVWDNQRSEWVLRQSATLYRVTDDGNLEELVTADGKTWALKLRNKVADSLNQYRESEHACLRTVSDELLVTDSRPRPNLLRAGYLPIMGRCRFL